MIALATQCCSVVFRLLLEYRVTASCGYLFSFSHSAFIIHKLAFADVAKSSFSLRICGEWELLQIREIVIGMVLGDCLELDLCKFGIVQGELVKIYEHLSLLQQGVL